MSAAHEHGNHHGGHDTMGTHGMLLFGEGALYLSHLPMFENPHNFQVILEVAFDDAAAAAFLADRAADGADLYTFVPVDFPITDLDPEGDGPVRTSIDGTIFRGHFERGGQELTPATAGISRVVRFAELDVQAAHATDRELTYLCFGQAGQLHLAHQITARPDFDQILTVDVVPGTVRDPAGRPVGQDVTGDFPRAVPVRIDGRTDIPASRLKAGETVTGSFFASVGPTGSHGFIVDVTIDRQAYLELRELGSV